MSYSVNYSDNWDNFCLGNLIQNNYMNFKFVEIFNFAIPSTDDFEIYIYQT